MNKPTFSPEAALAAAPIATNLAGAEAPAWPVRHGRATPGPGWALSGDTLARHIVPGAPMLAPPMLRAVAPSVSPVRAVAREDFEHELALRLLARESRAYEILVAAYGDRMFAAAHRRLRDAGDAHDAVQEALTSAFRAIASFRPGTALWPWLRRIVINASIDRLRARRRMVPTTDSMLEHQAGLAGMGAADPGHEHEQADSRAVVRQCLARLPKPYRRAMWLRYVDGLEVEAIASVLSIPVNTVKTRLHRGRDVIRRMPEIAELSPTGHLPR